MAQLAYLLSSFQARDFRVLWLSTLSSSAGMWTQQVAVGWLVLELTNSPLSLGIVSASRMALFLFLGMPAGALADRIDRRNLLIAVTALAAAYSFAMALIVVAGVVQFWHVVALTLLFGGARAFESPARQALVYDLVGPSEALKGISLNAIGMRLMGIVGGILGGVMIPVFGVEGSFLLMGLSYTTGALALFAMKPSHVQNVAPSAAFWSSLRAGLALLRGNNTVLLLVLMSVVAEVFAFSHGTLTPVFARDVLGVGAVGLGMLTSMLALGGIGASIVLAALTNYGNKVQLLLWTFGLYGCFLVLFAISRSYALSLFLIMGVGAMAASFDTLQQVILQLSVRDAERGRVMGYWVASLGFGPLGHLELGAVAGLVGAPLALAANGGIVLATSLVVALVVGARGLIRVKTGLV